MCKLFLMTDEERTAELRNIIRCKCRIISADRLALILSKLNSRRRYFIKVTSNPDKFVNIMTSEFIVTSSEKIISEIIPIYGSFTSGLFLKTETEKKCEKGIAAVGEPSAGIKITIGVNNSIPVRTHTLVIYEPV